jgi:hypothetical protein
MQVNYADDPGPMLRQNPKLLRTRVKLGNKGVVGCLEDSDSAMSNQLTDGFKALVENGQIELTGEHLVTKYADRFSAEAVTAGDAWRAINPSHAQAARQFPLRPISRGLFTVVPESLPARSVANDVYEVWHAGSAQAYSPRPT